jgi:hypothetical protein
MFLALSRSIIHKCRNTVKFPRQFRGAPALFGGDATLTRQKRGALHDSFGAVLFYLFL